jgi:hypothetical protein
MHQSTEDAYQQGEQQREGKETRKFPVPTMLFFFQYSIDKTLVYSYANHFLSELVVLGLC